MGILAELLLMALGWLAEILLQLLFEVLAEMGWRVVRAPFARERELPPWVVVPGYAVFGAAAGGLSLLVFPLAYLHGDVARIANLVVAPLVAGVVMSAVGAWRRRRGQALLRLDSFAYGALFALAFALVRWRFADLG